MKKDSGFNWKRMAYILLLFLLAAIFIGCTAQKKPAPSKLKPLKVASDTTYPPFEFIEGGKPAGFDIDIAEKIAERLKLRLEVVRTNFEDLFRDLRAGKVDMAMSALVVTEERKKEVDFSDSYVTGNQAIVTYKDSSIKSEDDLAGKIIGAEIDTTGELLAKQIPNVKKVKTYKNSDEALRDLKSRAISAIVGDYLIYANLLKHEPQLLIVAKIGVSEDYGIAFRKGSELRARVNKTISEMKKDGTYNQIFEKWFGEQE